MAHGAHSYGADERGANLVEFALILPVLALLIFGILEFAMLFHSHLELRSGAREAARLAAVDNGCSVAPSTCPSGSTARHDKLVADVRARLTSLDDPAAADITVFFPDGAAAGKRVKVCLSYPIQPMTGLFSAMFAGQEIRSEAFMRLEQAPTYSADPGGPAC